MSEILKHKIRKNLNRWSRKLLVSIGLESIGRELVGEVKWEQIYPLQQVWKQQEISDFDPTEVPEQHEASTIPRKMASSPCTNSNLTTTSNTQPLIRSQDLSQIDPSDTAEEETNEEKNDFLDNIFHFLPYWYFINRAFGVPGIGAANTISEDLGEPGHNHSNSLLEVFDTQRLLFLRALEQQQHQQELQNQCENPERLERPFLHVQNLPFLPFSDPAELVNNCNASQVYSSESNQNGSTFISPSLSAAMPHPDEPLDLTKKHKNFAVNEEINSQFLLFPMSQACINAGGDMKSVRTNAQIKTNKVIAKTNQRAGRGYTTEELEAALQDIQSGKLGTRRAAVIYGIPRSTLRNKVYKLGKDRNRTFLRQRTSTKRLPVKEKNTILHGSPLSDTEETIDNHQALLGLENTKSKSNLNLPNTSFIPLYSVKSSHNSAVQDEGNLDELRQRDGISHEKKVLKEWLRTKLSRQNYAAQMSSNNESLMLNEVSTYVNLKHSSPHDSSNDGISDASNKQETRQDVILKIPCLLNAKSMSKRVIMKRKRSPKQENSRKSILNKSGPDNQPIGVEYWKRTRDDVEYNSSDSSEVDSNNEITVDPACDNFIEPGQDFISSSSRHNSFNKSPFDTDSNEKKCRPKRGKYRNYDRDALLKAVKAVQNGEMSVHRAGSYYGVPHSTLEYKVKERHLLRRPKKRGVGSPKSNQKSSPESSLSGKSGSEALHLQENTPELFQIRGESVSLPLPSDLRESLNRYLNINNTSLGPYSSPSSPETPFNSGEANSNETHDDHHDSGHDRASTSPAFNVLSTFRRLSTTIGQTRENGCLLDLSKKI